MARPDLEQAGFTMVLIGVTFVATAASMIAATAFCSHRQLILVRQMPMILKSRG
jgi:hypothetical protein